MRSYMGRSIALHGKSSRRRSKTTSLPSSHPGVNVIDEELSSGSVGGPIGPQRNSADPNNDDCKAACRLVHTGASTSVRTTHQSIEHLFEVGSSTVEHVTIGATQPGRVPSILRALRRRCPVCGSKEISRHPVQVYDRCPTCDLDLERQVGSFIGGIGLNTILAFVVLLLGHHCWIHRNRGRGLGHSDSVASVWRSLCCCRCSSTPGHGCFGSP